MDNASQSFLNIIKQCTLVFLFDFLLSPFAISLHLVTFIKQVLHLPAFNFPKL